MKRIDREKGRRTIYAHRGPEQTARIVRFSIDLCLEWIIRFAMRGRRFRSIDFHPFERDVLSQIHASTSLESIQSSQIAVEKWVKRIEGGGELAESVHKDQIGTISTDESISFESRTHPILLRNLFEEGIHTESGGLIA